MNGVSLDDYAAFFETLTPATLQGLDRITTDDVRFIDPFNDVRGRAAMRRVLEKMFEDVRDPRFAVGAQARVADTGFLEWRFEGRLARPVARPFSIAGVSTVRFAACGRVVEHIDHWDAAAQVYERIPVLGFVLRRIRNRLASSPL